MTNVREEGTTTAVFDDDVLVRYLLGQTAPEEGEAIEGSYLRDEELFLRLRDLEAQLIDDYWSGRLRPERRAPFESHYLSTPPRRERAELGRRLGELARAAAPAPGAAGLAAAEAGRRPSHRREAAWQLAALLALLLGGSLVVWERWGPARPPGVTDEAARHQLQPGRLRGEAAGASFRWREAPLELGLVVVDGAAGPYAATLETPEGRVVWRAAGLAAVASAGGWSVPVDLPAGLSAGDYLLRLAPERPDGEAWDYFFRVVRPDP